MNVILLAAGLGTRLRPLTDTVPKCLVPILGKPLLEIWLERLFDSKQIEKVLINTHYLPHVVVDFVNKSRWKNYIQLIHEPILLGTGGTLLFNKEWINNEVCMVAHADNLTLFDVNEFIEAHKNRPNKCLITMMTFVTDDPSSCGIVELKNNIVVAFHEKVKSPPSNIANAAIYIFEPNVIENMIDLNNHIIDLSTEVLPAYMGRIFAYHNNIYHRDIGNPQSLELAQVELKKFKFI